MATELNEHEFPAGGGWLFRQPQTGWVNPYAMVGFKASVEAIIKHRLANKAITAKHSLATAFPAVAEELKKYTRFRLGIPEQPSPSFFRPSPSISSHVVAAAAGIKRAAQGTAVIVDWLMSGGPPVEQTLADKRAAVCATCPKNVDGSWYTVAPATLIKETIESRKDLNLETPSDSQLKSCDVCKCLMRLKVWVPLHFIASHTKSEVMNEFPSHCWIYRRDQ